MRHFAVALSIAALLLAPWGTAPSLGQETGRRAAGRMMIALDLMDLEIPGEGGGNEMELPPIQETERPEVEAVPSSPPERDGGFEPGRAELPPAGISSPSPGPGLAPFLLEEADMGGDKGRAVTEPAGGRSSGALVEDLPAELKAVPPPPTHAESLKLPSGMDGSPSRGSDVPEIPLLKGGDRGQPTSPPAGGGDSFLTLKPLPDRGGTPGARLDARATRERRRPEDYLQVREEIDSRLIEIYERYYKNR